MFWPAVLVVGCFRILHVRFIGQHFKLTLLGQVVKSVRVAEVLEPESYIVAVEGAAGPSVKSVASSTSALVGIDSYTFRINE